MLLFDLEGKITWSKKLYFLCLHFFPFFFQISRTKLSKGKNRSVAAGASKSSSSSKQTIANENFPPVKRKGGNKRKISWQDDYSIQVCSNVIFCYQSKALIILLFSVFQQSSNLHPLFYSGGKEAYIYILSTQRSMLFLSYICC